MLDLSSVAKKIWNIKVRTFVTWTKNSSFETVVRNYLALENPNLVVMINLLSREARIFFSVSREARRICILFRTKERETSFYFTREVSRICLTFSHEARRMVV